MRQLRPRYYSLNKGSDSLMAQINHVLPPGAIIAQVEYGTYADGPKAGRPKYCFEYFSGFGDFFDHYRTVPHQKRHYYEMILPDARRKPYFDIDAKVQLVDAKKGLEERQLFLEKLIEAIASVFTAAGVSLDVYEDIVVIDSSGPKDGSFKISLHIIVTNWFLKDAEQSLEFYRRTMLALDTSTHPHWANWVDRGVYSRGRCFRILGSCKIGSSRNLVLLPHWSYRGKTIQSTLLGEKQVAKRLYTSMVTTTANARAFPKLELTAPKRSFENTEREDVSDDETAAAMILFEEYLRDNGGLVGRGAGAIMPFEKRSVAGTLILFNRTRPSYCDLCTRMDGKQAIHESETPYLTIVDNAVYFHCRRADQKGHGSIYLGSIGPDDDEDKGEDEEEEEEEEEEEHEEENNKEENNKEQREDDSGAVLECKDPEGASADEKTYVSENGAIVEKPQYNASIFSGLDRTAEIKELFRRRVILSSLQND